MKKIYKLGILIYISTFMTSLIFIKSCHYDRKDHYVATLDLTVSIDRIGVDLYRVYLNKAHNHTDSNYIDIHPFASDMNSLVLHFPLHKSGTTDTVYVREDESEVLDYESKDFHLIVPELKDIRVGPDMYISEWADSTMFKIPCTWVMIDPFYDGMTVFDDCGNILPVTR